MKNPIHTFAAFLFRRRLRGAARFHALLCGKAPLSVSSKHGIKFRLDPHEYVSAMILRNGYYEEEVLDAILEDMRADDVFWDVGACVGLHALTVAKLHSGVRVCAFEPNLAMAGLIRSSMDENVLQIEIRALALGAVGCSSEFYVEKSNAGMSGLGQWGRTADSQKIFVTIATADSLISSADLPAPTVVKIDVEGSELDVLRGMTGQLGGAALRRVIFEDSNEEGSCVKVLLSKFGFKIRRLNRLEDTHHALDNYVAFR